MDVLFSLVSIQGGQGYHLVGGWTTHWKGQIGSFPQIGVTTKSIWNHHPVEFLKSSIQDQSKGVNDLAATAMSPLYSTAILSSELLRCFRNRNIPHSPKHACSIPYQIISFYVFFHVLPCKLQQNHPFHRVSTCPTHWYSNYYITVLTTPSKYNIWKTTSQLWRVWLWTCGCQTRILRWLCFWR